MASAAQTSEADITDAVEEAAERLLADLDDVSGRLTDHIIREIPELGDEPEIRAEWRASNRANISAWLDMMRRGIPTAEMRPPDDALQVARTYVLRGAPLAVLLRVYRVGHNFVFAEWLGALRDRQFARELLDVIIERSLERSFAYVDAMSTHVAETYARERANAARSADLARTETVRAILASTPADVDRASRVLGYELRRWHVALALWAEPKDEGDDPVGRLEAAAHEVAAALGGSRPLLIPAAQSLLWAWCGTADPLSSETLAALATGRRTDGVSVTLGDPGDGPAGFARSHREALEARRVCLLARRSAGTVALHRDLDLLALLTTDLEAAARFVETELGALAAGDDTTLRLRSTLRAFLEEGHGFSAAARRLGIHENTAKYRVRQCEEILGRSVATRSLKLEAALVLADALARRR